MTGTDQLLENAAAYAASFDKGALPLPPAKQIAIVAGMGAQRRPPAQRHRSRARRAARHARPPGQRPTGEL